MSWVGISVLAASAAFASPEPPHPQSTHSVTAQDARRLAYAALSNQQRGLPGLEIHPDGESLHFLFFTFLWNNPGPGSVVVTHRAIDRDTADVWDWVSACGEIQSKRLRQLQRQIREAAGITPASYLQKRRTCPLEMDELPHGT